MTIRRSYRHFVASAICVALAATRCAASSSSGVWSNPAGGLWSNANDWLSHTVADGGTADFSILSLTADASVHLDSPRSFDTFDVGDSAVAHDWHFDNNGSSNNTLALASPTGTATLTVDNQSAFFDLTLTGANNLFKGGPGTLVIQQPATYTGTTTLSFGEIISGVDNALPTVNALTLAGGTTLDLNGHNQQITSLLNFGTVTNTDRARTSVFTIATDGSDPVTANLTGNIAFTKQGTGNVFILGDAFYTGLTTVNAGNLFFNTDNVSIGTVVGNGNLVLAPDRGLETDALLIANVTILNGAKFTVRPNGASTSVITNLSLAGDTNAWISILDLNDNKLILQPAAADKPAALATVQNQVAFATAPGTTGGILSSDLPRGTALAVLDNAVTRFTTFGDQPVDANSILIAAELLGDANADGTVDLTDFSTVLNNFGTSTPNWTSGNFDNAPTIDLTDLSAVLNNFGLSIPSATTSQLQTISAPEPATLALLWLAAFAPMRRRLYLRKHANRR